jgi:hypothetical protein
MSDFKLLKTEMISRMKGSDRVRYSTFITGAVPALPYGKGRQSGDKVKHWDLKGYGRWIVSLWCT